MTLDVTGVLRDAWVMAKRDRQILMAIAGLLIFVPQYGVLLFMTPKPPFPGWDAAPDAIKAYSDATAVWLTMSVPGILIGGIMALIGHIAITLLYVDHARPSVADALTRAPMRFFPALLVMMVASPTSWMLQLQMLLIVPAVWLEGRLLLAMPILLGDPPVSPFGAIGQSWRRTKGHSLVTAALVCITVVGGYLIAVPFLLLGQALDGAPLHNPVVAVLLDGGAALGVTLGAVATILVQVVLYRRLSSGT